MVVVQPRCVSTCKHRLTTRCDASGGGLRPRAHPEAACLSIHAPRRRASWAGAFRRYPMPRDSSSRRSAVRMVEQGFSPGYPGSLGGAAFAAAQSTHRSLSRHRESDTGVVAGPFRCCNKESRGPLVHRRPVIRPYNSERPDEVSGPRGRSICITKRLLTQGAGDAKVFCMETIDWFEVYSAVAHGVLALGWFFEFSRRRDREGELRFARELLESAMTRVGALEEQSAHPLEPSADAAEIIDAIRSGTKLEGEL